MSGGVDADIFRFDSSLNGRSNVDQITDFNVAETDLIDLQNSIFTALPTTGTLAARAFHVGSSALTRAHRILFIPLLAKAFATATPGLSLANLPFVIT